MFAPTRSTRFLARLATVVLALAVAVAALTLVGAAFGFSPVDAVAARTQVEGRSLTDLPAGVVAPDDVELTVQVRGAGREQVRWAAARDLAPIALVVAVTWLLRALLRAVRDGDAFSQKNVGRLRALALLVLIGVPLAGFVASIFAGELATSAGLAGPGTELALSGSALLGGASILVLAEVFAAGLRLRTDLEGTV